MKKIATVATRSVSGAQVIVVRSAVYQDSAPFPGVFEVWDVDNYRSVHSSTGKLMATVRCCLGDTLAHEDSTLDLELLDLETEVIGYDGDVVDRIHLTRN